MTTKQTKEKIIEIIKKEIPWVDIKPFSDNIINIELRILAENYGQNEVIELVKNTKLKELGWGYILEVEST
tara:strand:+ start:161 stop:373 length:213 start_codon:yes stop_codon:yes gene_type:complete